MASTVTLALQSIDSSRRFITRKYLCTLADDYAALGMVLDFTAATNPNFLEGAVPGYGAVITDDNVKLSLPNPNGNGYTFRIQKGTTFANSVLRIYESGADGGDLDEIATAALPAAVSGDANIYIELTTPVGF